MNVLPETLIAQSDCSVQLEFCVPADSGYVDGHFDSCKLVPAAAQLLIAAQMAHRYLGTGAAICSAKRLKFAAPMRPDVPVRLTLERNAAKDLLAYSMRSADGTRSFSSGTFIPAP